MKTSMGEDCEVRYKGMWSTTGQFSWWSFEDCVREEVYLMLWNGNGRSKVCFYPGRGLTRTEEMWVLEKYKKVGRTLTEQELRDAIYAAAWEDAHVLNEEMDMKNAEKFAVVLTS